MKELNNAKYIKAMFIDYLLNNKMEDKIIGSEVMFAYKRVVADLIQLSNGNIEAFEIKSKNDDLRKIISQIEEYNKVFDYVNVIITENHFEKVKKLLKEEVGIIILTKEENFEIYRNSQQNFKLNKEDILSTMTLKFLLRYFNLTSKKLLTHELRESLKEYSLIDLKKAMYKFLYDRISYKFINFLLERGNITHYEEILLLSMPNKKIIL